MMDIHCTGRRSRGGLNSNKHGKIRDKPEVGGLIPHGSKALTSDSLED